MFGVKLKRWNYINMEMNELKSLITKASFRFGSVKRASGVFSLPEGFDPIKFEQSKLYKKILGPHNENDVSVRKEMTGNELLKLWMKK